MMQTKLKKCAGCQIEKVIWKSHKKDKYCKECWYKIEKPKSISQISKKRKDEMDKYGKLREGFLIVKPKCEVQLLNCTGASTEVHHKVGRTGDNYLKINTWLAVCRNCHTWITENSKEAIELGFSDSRLNA